ncbi:MAG TPA: hypothetical protein VHE77_03445 [Dongiaceae bacterium]|jgi:hypothetical protein|nr:hypothetical protein [Dongiaceae bacterium]
MGIWSILEWIAWALSALMLIWMVMDAWKVSRNYSEAQLLSSREGVDDLFGDQKKGA